MINIVMWLDNGKCTSEFTLACAANDIRIVADEFCDTEDFLSKFDAIDMNIDVLVIGNGNIEGIDKRSFFEEVCVTEPNIRTVIVFPGYRNEYVDEQIAEYRNLGITDIIYEGAGLDEIYFADVIRKGYVYPTETVPEKSRFWNIKEIFKRKGCDT